MKMKKASRVVGITGIAVALIGIVGRGLGLETIYMADGPHSPMTFVELGILGVAVAIWLAVSFGKPHAND
jgi:hypothetical protein